MRAATTSAVRGGKGHLGSSGDGSVHSCIVVRRTPATRGKVFLVPSLAKWGASATSILTSLQISPRAFPKSCKCSRNRGRSLSSATVVDGGFDVSGPKVLTSIEI